jgi:phosphoribosylformylglycinamidine synthase I
MKPKVLVIRAAGSNCENETAWAYELAGAKADIKHINSWLDKPSMLDDYQGLAIPGGFSYGDDIASGKILANQLRFNLMQPIEKLLSRGGLILGICNGFQVLVKAGLLGQGQVTLTHNDSGKYIDTWVRLKNAKSKCLFLKNEDEMDLPIAHAEGKIVLKQGHKLAKMESAGEIALYYEGFNPNGSEGDIAGLCDPSGQILGLMPHPERFLRFENHPQWTRQEAPVDGKGDGFAIFKNAVEHMNEL